MIGTASFWYQGGATFV